MTAFSDWLQLKFEEWEKSKGRRRQSYTAFARYLGVTQSSLAHWMMGDNLPDTDSMQKLSEKLGYEIYSVLGVDPPYPHAVHEIKAAYNGLPSEVQPEFQDDLDQFLTEWLIAHGFTRTK